MDVLHYTLEHIGIVLTAMLIAAAVGVSLGVVASWYRKWDSLILWVSDMIQTIPTLALLSILMILFGLGNTTLITALVLYSLLPVIRNTYTGIKALNPAIIEAAKGMGMSRVQYLFRVQLPLALPMIFSGIRIALVTALGITVIGVLIGAGGLGKLIYRGIQTQNFEQMLYGAIPVMILAILSDFLISKLEKRLSRQNT